ncbi:AhpC-TSA-domain-containing protein, partial [Violaceomyces palustris]
MAPKAASAQAPAERRQSSRIASKASAAETPAAPAPSAPKRKKNEAEPVKVEGKPDENKQKQEATSSSIKKAKVDTEEKKPSSGGGGTGQLKVGDKLPTLTLKDQDGNEVQVASLKKVVIFSYPKANTPGCTKQGQCFRDSYSEWSKSGYEVYGLSNDNPTPLKNWKEKQSFPYKLLSDPDRKLIGPLTGSKSSTKRSHFVVDQDGKLSLVSVGVKPAE